ncbi:unnamed protein product [Rotaria sp. Silwood1]|nr:unnamed protein product [Rotaria sp. Silwood1]CAF1153914.1 unnamed protein product [Rotaria sp. Silwood1]CAF3501652.1 unnamed protein product [Rotaria sp. Silwood1]CAF4822916.1 unnamed protein product [Rotaria sp. Silwood1]CAF4892760.1 unnamed protein product [Rotaria sp. Silwood1]
MSFQQQIQKESERFHTLYDRLFDTQWSEAALPEAHAQLAVCENQARLTQDNIDAFNAAADKEYERLVDIKGHGVRHAWYKIQGKLEQRLDEQEMTWLRDFEKSKEEEQRLSLLKKEIKLAQAYLQQCQDAYEEYTKTKKELDELLEYIFSGITQSYPEEDITEQNLKKEEEHLSNLQNNHRVLTRVIYFLEKAHQAISVSCLALDEALNMNTFDLCSDSSFADMAAGSYLAQARNASAEAQQFINEARHIYPNMPNIDDLYIKQDNLVFNILLDEVMSNTNMKRMIQESLDCISKADAAVMCVLFEIKEKLNECEADREMTSRNVKRLAAEHFRARIAIARQII